MAKISRTRVTEADTSNMDMPHDVEREVYAEEETPRPTRPVRSAVSSGWGAKQEERAETVKAPNLVLKDNGTRVIKILDEMPPVKYKRHYINSKNRYFTCLQTGCPLCAATPPDGRMKLRASWTFIMNVVDMADGPDDDGVWEVKTWTFGNEVAGQLESIATSKAALDDEQSYFEVKHVPVAGRKAPRTDVSFIRGRYIMDEHSLQPLNENEIALLLEDRYGAEVVQINDTEYLEDIASEVVVTDFPVITKRS